VVDTTFLWPFYLFLSLKMDTGGSYVNISTYWSGRRQVPVGSNLHNSSSSPNDVIRGGPDEGG
jgi:hypothetical protein